MNSLEGLPHIAGHLQRFRSILSGRREVANGRIRYFQLQWPRSEHIFTDEKIVVPYRAETNSFAYNSAEWFCRSDCYVLTKKSPAYDLRYFLALLNSKLYFQCCILHKKYFGILSMINCTQHILSFYIFCNMIGIFCIKQLNI